MSDGESTCPKCFKKNPTGAAFCGHCGADIRAAAPAAAGVEKRTMFGYKADPAVLQAAAAAEAAAPALAPAAAPAAGLTKVGEHYALGAACGQLPTGTLYDGQDTSSGVPVEVLLVDDTVFPSPLDLERARRELRQLQKVESPNLLRVLDHGRTNDGRLYVVTEKVVGSSLADLVAAGALPIADAQRVIRGVGVGLSEAQKVGVIHRDIAPHNIVLQQDGTVRVRGFGVAAPIKRNVFGTAEFISPEQAAGRPVDQRSNIYSLGALMFFMVTGEPPFRGDVDQVLAQHQSAEPPSPADRRPDVNLSVRATQLVAKALAKSSSRRHLTLRQFLREVEAIDGGDDGQPQQRQKTPTFETPLHGVTSLSGGDRPPSSEYQPVTGASAAETLVDQDRQARPSGAVTAASGGAVSGEMAGGSRVSMRQTEEQAAAKAAGAAAGKGAAPAAPGKGPGGFRETMWFVKGEIESAMAESGEAQEAAVEASAAELQEKYKDDGSLNAEEARRLSLRTGKTQMMQAVSVPSGQLPGEKMKEEDFISEMNKGRRLAIWIGIGVVVLGAVGTVLYLFVLR